MAELVKLNCPFCGAQKSTAFLKVTIEKSENIPDQQFHK